MSAIDLGQSKLVEFAAFAPSAMYAVDPHATIMQLSCNYGASGAEDPSRPLEGGVNLESNNKLESFETK